MKMSKEHTLEFFEVLDADKSGGLSIGEFKDFLFSEECRDGNLHLNATYFRFPKLDAKSKAGAA